MPLLLDTGILYAVADADDHWHEPARNLLRATRETLLVPVTVLPDVAYLLATRLGHRAERRFVDSIVSGELDVEPVSAADLARCADILDRYPSIGLVDASIVAIAERLRLRTIATTDRRHFEAIQPAHVSHFELVPPPLQLRSRPRQRPGN